ncbi:hypothetical protein H8B02_29470 [Bradyrhizobium sp. Pear77]|nr:hypothetical protein [Bradyrhizobium altum]
MNDDETKLWLPREQSDPVVQADVPTSRKGTARPMTTSDVPAVARLFLKVFGDIDKPASGDLKDYFHASTLGSPSYSAVTGTQIYQQQDGHISSALRRFHDERGLRRCGAAQSWSATEKGQSFVL